VLKIDPNIDKVSFLEISFREKKSGLSNSIFFGTGKSSKVLSGELFSR
jgi:hypothetical protein